MTESRTIVIVLVTVVACGAIWLFRPSKSIPDVAGSSAAMPPMPVSQKIQYAPAREVIKPDTITLASTNDSTQPDTGSSTETLELTREQIDAYLTKKNRGAVSLIAAYSLTHDTNFLYEAARNYSDNSHVQLAVLAANLFPGDRWRWLEAFKQSAPDNSLANYLAACEYFKAGQPEQAVGELTEASGKSSLNMYWLDNEQAVIEVYVNAGFTPAVANLLGFANSIPQSALLSASRQLSRDIIALANQDRQDGDIATADNLITSGLTLGNRLATGDTGKLLINELVGNAIQVSLLSNLNPSTAVEFDGTTQTVAERLADLQARKSNINDLIKSTPLDALTPLRSSNDDVLTYFGLVRTDGELAAMQWLRDKLGPAAPPQPSASERK